MWIDMCINCWGGGLGVQLDMHVHWTYWNRNFSSETLVESFDKHCKMSYIVVVEPTSMTKLIAHPVYRWLAIKVCLSSQQQSNNQNNWNNSLTEQISDSQFTIRIFEIYIRWCISQNYSNQLLQCLPGKQRQGQWQRVTENWIEIWTC